MARVWWFEACINHSGKTCATNKLASPECKIVRATLYELFISDMLIFSNAEMPGSDFACPVTASFSRWNSHQVQGIQGRNSNLGDLGMVAFVFLKVDRDEDGLICKRKGSWGIDIERVQNGSSCNSSSPMSLLLFHCWLSGCTSGIVSNLGPLGSTSIDSRKQPQVALGPL